MTTGLAPADELSRDFSQLENREVYGLYFSLLSSVGQKLLQTYAVADGQENYEVRMMKVFLEKLLYTIRVLRIKFTHSPAHNRKLWIDLSDSGFPNHAEIAKLETDMLSRQEQLLDIPTEQLLKLRLLDFMFARHEESADLLWQLSERAYLELLDPDRLFLAFTPGELVRRADVKNNRAYTYSWGCYDFETNRPYMHVMAFEQDMSEEPLVSNPTGFRQFMKVVRAEGSRVPEIGILAFAIDDALEPIHPKIVKRVCIGPMFSPLLFTGTPPAKEVLACSLLKQFGSGIEDFCLFYTTEVLFSARQSVTGGGFFSKSRVREIFHIPQTDEQAFKRRASIVNQNVMIPHSVLQHMTREDQASLELGGIKIITYDEKGDVHGA